MHLPIDESRDNIVHHLSSLDPGGRLVLSAPTGSGKSTRLPVWCHELGLGPVLVIEPRRVACRTLAAWVAEGLGQVVGSRVGYCVRYEQAASEQTEILFVTPGIARRYLAEGTISHFSTIIFDEFHERSWETDTVMATLAARKHQQRLILMSATLAADRLVAAYQAQRVESLGRCFPVEISYRTDGVVKFPSTSRLTERVVEAIEESWDGVGSSLVFLPGLAVMREVKQRLPRLPVRLLHGSFTNASQDDAFRDDAPRVVLATNVAESSLTVPGITTVIDSGLEKRAIHQSGYVALSTVPIALSSAQQRAGRAGRTAPGRCLRLWDEAARLETSRPPDLERMELDELVLFLAGLPDGLSTPLQWLDTPPSFAWERALLRLQNKGLIDDSGQVTELGHQAARLPVEPDWARILVLAPPELRADLCDLHAFSSGRRGLSLAGASHEQIEQRKEELGEEPWRRTLATLRLGHPKRHGLDPEALQEARRLSQELKDALSIPTSERVTPHPQLSHFLAVHWPERHFVRRQRREAWGNGEVECRTARGEELPEECLAAFFLCIEPVATRGLKVELRGSHALPTSLASLNKAGYGTPELSKVRFRDGQVIARVAQIFAGRTLAQSEDILIGAPLREALVKLAVEGQWKPEVLEHWHEFRFYAALQASLTGEPRTATAEQLFRERLDRLGIESSDELELLNDDDYLPEPCDEGLRKAYPRQYSYGGVAYDVDYLPERKLVRLHWRSGPKNAKPNAAHLPRWNGWRIEIDERGRVTPLR